MIQIERKDYMDTLKALRDKNLIKVLTGVRRCGKSTVMQMFRDYLRADGVKENQIVFLNFEDYENRKYLNNLDALYYDIINQLDINKRCYVFLDEIQQVKEFERLVDGLYVKPNIDVYVTGSNAYLLSSELGTLLTGRYISIHVLPFSFKEYLLTQTDISRTDLLFAKYLDTGGMPGIFDLPENMIRNYILDVVQNIIQKDVLVRNKWKNEDHFNKTLSFLFDSVGSVISTKKITNYLKTNNNIAISHHTVANYIDAVVESYLFYKVRRFDLRGKGLLQTQEKYYTVDLGLKKYFLGDKISQDLGHNLENIVYLELLRRGNSVHIGKADNTEIDFVIRTPKNETEYIQVAWTTKENSTFEREIRPFELVNDFNRRILLTTDVEPATTYKGIQKINVIDWLLKE
ncbi:MAG: ATP-binding protein [Lentimicrobiaceae bacterium]|jgi:predicted AAA+ superfamily ATPase|nr:ATP-binding protein [Lentimicrobiaceae bacterium]